MVRNRVFPLEIIVTFANLCYAIAYRRAVSLTCADYPRVTNYSTYVTHARIQGTRGRAHSPLIFDNRGRERSIQMLLTQDSSIVSSDVGNFFSVLSMFKEFWGGYTFYKPGKTSKPQ